MNEIRQTAYAALILRTALAVMFIAHAILKLAVFTPAGTAQFFASVGLPPFLAYVVIVIELLAGIMLLLGTQTRLVSMAMIPLLMGTIVTVHGSNGWLFSNANGGWEYPAFLIMALITQVLLGDGAYSLASRFKQVASAGSA